MGQRTVVIIITCHGLGRPRSPVLTPVDDLARDLEALLEAGFTFVTLDDCADWLAGGRELPRLAAALTFDDGYASVAADGLPLLSRLGIPSTAFVIAARVGQGNQWPGQSRHVPPMPLLTTGQLAALVEAGVTIGSHSLNHEVLPALDDDRLHAAVVQSADRLEELCGVQVRHFSYPYGRTGRREIELVRVRYRTAVTTQCRRVDRRSDPHALPRIDIHDLMVARRLGLIGGGIPDAYLTVRRLGRRCRRLAERTTGAGWEGVR